MRGKKYKQVENSSRLSPAGYHVLTDEMSRVSGVPRPFFVRWIEDDLTRYQIESGRENYNSLITTVKHRQNMVETARTFVEKSRNRLDLLSIEDLSPEIRKKKKDQEERWLKEYQEDWTMAVTSLNLALKYQQVVMGPKPKKYAEFRKEIQSLEEQIKLTKNMIRDKHAEARKETFAGNYKETAVCQNLAREYWFSWQSKVEHIRIMYLVYGFLRGKKYRQIEPKTRIPFKVTDFRPIPNPDRLNSTSAYWEPDISNSRQKFILWMSFPVTLKVIEENYRILWGYHESLKDIREQEHKDRFKNREREQDQKELDELQQPDYLDNEISALIDRVTKNHQDRVRALEDRLKDHQARAQYREKEKKEHHERWASKLPEGVYVS